MKITIIGGGSYSWTPMIVRDFINNDFYTDAIICLMDINETALNDIYELCTRSTARSGRGKSITFQKTTSLTEALDGASYVIVAISHGGLDAELEDHRIARKYGFYNMKGSEVGIAGCSRTLRHVPEFVRIAREMEKYCSNAMLLNVTNPLTALTRAVNRYTSIKAVGFCHGVVNHLGILFPFFGAKSWDGIDFNVAGVDHCSWLLSVRHHGRDVLRMMKDQGLIEAAKKGSDIAIYDDYFAGRENQKYRFLLWDILGYLPALSDEHCIEFFGQIIGTEELRRYYNIKYDRIIERPVSVKRARDNVQAALATDGSLDAFVSGEIIDKFIAALSGGNRFTDVLNYPNQGQIPNLPLESVVETKCLIDSNGVHPIHTGELPPILETVVRPIIIREELYMEAAMENNFFKLRSALSTDPIINDFRRIDDICKELLDYNHQFR